MCGLSALVLAAALAQAPPARGLPRFLNQRLGDVKPVAEGAALSDGGLREPFPLPDDHGPILAGEPTPLPEPPRPAAPAFLGGTHRFGSLPGFSATDGRAVLPLRRSAYSFHALPNAAGERAFRHGLAVEWADPNNAIGVSARFGANGLDSNQAGMAGDFGGEAKLLLLQAPGVQAVGGLALDAPFGNKPAGTTRPDAVAGPYVAALLSQSGNPWFVQAAERLDLPIGGEEPRRLRTSVGLGHWMRGEGELVSAWAPMAELHSIHPLSGPERSSLHGTLGFAAYFGGGAAFAAGVGVPIFGAGGALDGRVQLSWRY